MKHKAFRYSLLFGAITMLFAATSCTKLLDEQPRVSFTPAFFQTADGIQGGIAGIYSGFRTQWSNQVWSQLFNGGTDETVRGGSVDGGATNWFIYNQPQLIGTNTNNYEGFWNNLFTAINTANGVLQFGVDADIPAATKTQLLAQAKFLRGFCYFYLVTTFGAVPLHTTFNTSASTADAPAPLADLYAQIIQDLTEAAADLPNTPAAGLGKPAFKATALFLLAKSYLWRGWATNSTADFQQAYTTAKSVIDNKATYGLDLLPTFSTVFREGNEYGPEVMMVIDHTKDLKFGQNSAVGAGATSFSENKSNFMWRPNYPTVLANWPTASGAALTVRDTRNGRPFIRIRPNTRYVMEQAFSNRATDSRFEGTFQTVWLSNNTAESVTGSTGATTPRGTLINGRDTSIWLADRLVTPAERAAFKGVIFEPDHLAGVTLPYSSQVYPSVRKFDDSTRGHMNDYSDRPYILFRFAELYLIAAEAAIKGGGTTQQAADMINILRTRAARKNNQTPAEYAAAVIAQQVTAGQMTIDFLLDERSREMYAEDCRWWDLVRTQKLRERVIAFNSEAAAVANMTNFGADNHFNLRPIPQSQIDLVTEGPKYPQNPGYTQ